MGELIGDAIEGGEGELGSGELQGDGIGAAAGLKLEGGDGIWWRRWQRGAAPGAGDEPEFGGGEQGQVEDGLQRRGGSGGQQGLEVGQQARNRAFIK